MCIRDSFTVQKIRQKLLKQIAAALLNFGKPFQELAEIVYKIVRQLYRMFFKGLAAVSVLVQANRSTPPRPLPQQVNTDIPVSYTHLSGRFHQLRSGSGGL